MFNFFSDSSKKRRYPNPNRGGSYYKKGGFFGLGSSFSGSGSSRPGQQRGYQQNPYQGQQYGTPQNGASVCPRCGASVPAGSKFCLSCGEKMASAAFCANCGKPLPSGARFCPECGTPAGK